MASHSVSQQNVSYELRLLRHKILGIYRLVQTNAVLITIEGPELPRKESSACSCFGSNRGEPYSSNARSARVSNTAQKTALPRTPSFDAQYAERNFPSDRIDPRKPKHEYVPRCPSLNREHLSTNWACLIKRSEDHVKTIRRKLQQEE